jgi:hypothetical protein
LNSTSSKFESANPSVVRSIKQRVLLNAWLRASCKPQSLPVIADFQPDDIADKLADMMGYRVEGKGDTARFLITLEGATLAAAYGNDDPDSGPTAISMMRLDRTGMPQCAPCYRTLVARKRPTYTLATVQDADGKAVSYERLLLPLGSADHVDQIVGSYKAISIEGSFKINNLMGVKPTAAPVSVMRTVIDIDLFRGPGRRGASDDVVELN